MRTLFVVLLTVLCCSSAMHADDKATLGKLFVKAETNGQQFADPALEDTVKDMKAKHDKFVVVDDEAKADILIVVLDRQTETKTQFGTQINMKTIHANLSTRDGASWKPGIKLSGSNAVSWVNAAGKVIDDAEKWVKEKGGK